MKTRNSHFMPFDPLKQNLPIVEIIPQIITALKTESTLVVHAPPGAGKSTLVPISLFEQDFLQGKKIILLEPRRLAAKTIAMRMASLLDESVGHTVGYRIRFEQKVSKETKVEVLTEGILTRRLQNDPELEGIGLILFDEFHERSIHTDLALALCRQAQQIFRPDLRIIIMSATLNTEKLKSLLRAPILSSLGRTYPVEIKYGDGVDPFVISDIAARRAQKAFQENEGDILVFLPGEAEIKRCETELKRLLPKAEIHPLYGMLPPNRQMAAILRSKTGNRKVVLATSIAETSLTIEGIKVVIDSGLTRKQKFDPRSGLSRLETVFISKDAAEQRAGRAGRLSEGICYRLWTAADHDRLQQHDVPEILETDLCSLMLDLTLWGVKDPCEMEWMDLPPKGHVTQAIQTLESLGALNSGTVTEHGRKMLSFPCHPRIAHMLLMAESEHARQLACDISAIIEERDPLPKESGIDISLRVEALRRYRAYPNETLRIGKIKQVADSYLQLFGLQADNGMVDPYECGLLIAYAFPERIASSRPGNNSQYQMANGRYAQAGPKDDLGFEPWLAIAHVDARDGLGKIFLAAPLNPKDLAPMVKQQDSITWDGRNGELKATRELRIGSIILQSKPLTNPDENQIQSALCSELKKDGSRLLNWDESITQWQNRVLSLKKWRNDEPWPDVSTESLLSNPEIWLTPYLTGIKKAEDLKKIPLLEAVSSWLNWEQQNALEALAPKAITVPSGSVIALNYMANGDAPTLSVRLQQVFGLADTPRVNEGRITVVMELLSPANRPVQTTRDLNNFWNSTYFEVKKELKRRYPKHFWPDDPWTAPAIKGTRR